METYLKHSSNRLGKPPREDEKGKTVCQKRAYRKPLLTRIKLDPEQAILAQCHAINGAWMSLSAANCWYVGNVRSNCWISVRERRQRNSATRELHFEPS